MVGDKDILKIIEEVIVKDKESINILTSANLRSILTTWVGRGYQVTVGGCFAWDK